MRQAVYLFISSLFILPLSLSLNVKAQKSPDGPFSASMELRTAEQNLRSIPMKLRERRNQHTHDPKIAERMNEDFVRIQAIRIEMVREIAAGRSLQLKRLEQDSAEIRKRAARLKDSLALSDDKDDSLSIDKPKRIPKSLIDDAAFDLCLEISRFIENPIFKSGGVYTVRDAVQAARSLDTVISLAAAIDESAGRLRESN